MELKKIEVKITVEHISNSIVVYAKNADEARLFFIKLSQFTNENKIDTKEI